MPRPRTVVRLGAFGLLMVLAACSTPGGDAPGTADPEESSPGQTAPAGPPSSLTTGALDGQLVELEGAGSITLPSDATTQGVVQAPVGRLQVLYRMGDADEEGLPAVQVTWSEDVTVGVYEQSWTSEQAARGDANVTDYERAAVDWPGSKESVVATWTEEVPLTTGGTAVIDGMRLTVQSDTATVVVIAMAPAGELDGSEAVESLRTLSLG